MRIGRDVSRRSVSYPLVTAEGAVREMQESPLGIDDFGLGMALPLHEAEVPGCPAEPLFLSTEVPL